MIYRTDVVFFCSERNEDFKLQELLKKILRWLGSWHNLNWLNEWGERRGFLADIERMVAWRMLGDAKNYADWACLSLKGKRLLETHTFWFLGYLVHLRHCAYISICNEKKLTNFFWLVWAHGLLHLILMAWGWTGKTQSGKQINNTDMVALIRYSRYLGWSWAMTVRGIEKMCKLTVAVLLIKIEQTWKLEDLVFSGRGYCIGCRYKRWCREAVK